MNELAKIKELKLVWNIKVGDLVRLKLYPTGAENDYIYTTGLVMSGLKSEHEKQEHFWPTVDVYIFSSGTTRQCGPAGLEIISNS
jgi:hypothetical protein